MQLIPVVVQGADDFEGAFRAMTKKNRSILEEQTKKIAAQFNADIESGKWPRIVVRKT